jgi:uncharacterized transporter YbjL
LNGVTPCGLLIAVVTLFVAVCVLTFLVFSAVVVKSFHHEFMHLPGMVVCTRGDAPAMDYEVTGKAGHGHFKTFDLASCTFYWWENTRDDD